MTLDGNSEGGAGMLDMDMDMDMDANDVNDVNGVNDVNMKNNTRKAMEFENWDDAPLNKRLLRGIYAYGFEQPSPIQKKSIIPMTLGKDIIAQAQSGTGKTGAFSISTLELINSDENYTQAMIISPTRELSKQTYDVITNLSSLMTKVRTSLLIGGTSTESNISSLKEHPPHIIVGCPGRIHDMMRRQYINPAKLKVIVLDEADEMLSSGFKDQVYNIFQYLNNDVQVALFSATIPVELNILTEKFMRNPIKILVKADMITLEGISQYRIVMDDDPQKYEVLKDIYSIISMSQCIIYCNSVRRVASLYDAMKQDEFPVCCIHSGMDKEDRGQAYDDFKVGKYRVLISSNVTARGIDIQQVSTVINFDVPKDVSTYLHRIGRSGRWGRKGIGINFVTRRDVRKIREIEEYYSTEIPDLPADFGVSN
jgi:translation initiation factor 4A